MGSTFTVEQEQLRSVVRQFLEAKSPEPVVRELMRADRGFDEAVWKQMASELGLQGLAIPESYGGSGFGFQELSLVLEEMGRALLCAPYFSSVVLAAYTLLESTDEEAKADFLPRIAAGDLVATLAVVEESGNWDEGAIAASAVDNNGWLISGTKTFVLDGHVADLLLVVARTANGISLFAVDGDAPGVTRELLPTLDLTRKQAKVTFEGVAARLIGSEGNVWPTIERVLQLATVALAAEQVGGAQFVLDSAVDYAKLRIQFGRPIGSFQAIKHKCANMLLAVETARSAAYYAASCANESHEDFPLVASLAKAYCSEAYLQAATDNIQIHGGIGFTWEHSAHLYFKRAQTSAVLLGSPVHHRELVADRLGI
jgi:alkylation response protein AidB-like acyl-CoA dehydrogenase